MTFEQGNIVKFDFDPTKGHEQAGYRPALVISKTLFNRNTGQIIVCPITGRTKPFPLRIPLDSRTQTQGYIICDQVRTIDVAARTPKFSEKLPKDLLEKAIETVSAIFEME